ncbi:MAG TPA: C4-type zinc ribbon domain-containing protein [Longimicrobiales bacterium]|nr:C4-type zinc ribbon domain-containing protein [Longimicrobiales bacterium]
MQETYEALLELQDLDEQMRQAKEKVRRFEPELEELDAPLRQAEQELDAARKRLDELKTESRRLERAAADKQAHLGKYEGHLERARNAREEAAARTEIDLIRKALEADEDDALGLMEQVTRTELKVEELEKKLEAVHAEMDPRREELLAARDDAAEQLDVLEDQRRNKLVRLTGDAARLYERIRGGKTRVALATLTPDGACGHCFSMVPIQEQNEIRRKKALHRCEACGVILYAES